MSADLATQLWKSSQSEGLPNHDCTFVHFERLLHLELGDGDQAAAGDPVLRTLVHLVVGAYGHSDTRPGKRRAPSAGARYPVECLVLSWHGRTPRLWMVSLNYGRVVPMSEAYAGQVARATHAEPGEASVIVVASLWKTIERYGLAGVRYTVYDAGHVLSNLQEHAHDESRRLDLGLTLRTRSVFRELSNHVVALYAVRVALARPPRADEQVALRWPQRQPAAPAPAHVDPPSFSPLLARARRLFAVMGRELGDRELPGCSLTRGLRQGADWIEARRSAKGFVPRPAGVEDRDTPHLRPFVFELVRHAQRVYGLALGVAFFRRLDDGRYGFDGAVTLRDDRPVPESQSAQAFVEACNGQNQVPHAESIAVLFVQLGHLADEDRLTAAAVAQNCLGLVSAEIYRYCALRDIGTTMLCGFSSQKLGELMAGNADWPLTLHLFGREDLGGWKTDTRYLQ